MQIAFAVETASDSPGLTCRIIEFRIRENVAAVANSPGDEYLAVGQ